MARPFFVPFAVHALLLLLFSAVPSRAEQFSARQIRYFTSTGGGVDVELSRFGTYAALADWTEGNSVAVFDRHWEPLWRHRQTHYWGGTHKQPGILRFAPDESYLLATAYRTDNDIVVLDPASGRPLDVLTDHSGTVWALDLSGDGSVLVSYAQGELFLRRRSASSFATVFRLPEPTAPVTSLALSPDGSLLALAQNEERIRRLSLYRVAGDRLELLSSHEREESYLSREFGSLRFSPDGRLLAAAYHDGIYLWDLARGGEGLEPSQSIENIELGSVWSLAFSPDGALLLSGHYRDVRAYRLSGDRWKEEATFTPHQGGAKDLAFSEDGTQLAIAGRGETAGLGLWAIAGVGPSPLGALLSLLDLRVSPAQRAFLDDASARRILASLDPEDSAPRDMFETAEEYRLRLDRAKRSARAALALETEGRYGAADRKLPGGGVAVTVPLQNQGRYDADTKIYSFRFMEEDAAVGLERDSARALFRDWKEARIQVVRTEGGAGPAYGDFSLLLPAGGEAPVRLSRNPFTAEALDRFGARIPSRTVGPDLLVADLIVEGIFPSLLRRYEGHSIGSFELRNIGSAPLSSLSARFFIPGLMQAPAEAELPGNLGVAQSAAVTLRARLDAAALLRAGAGTASAELTLSYVSRGEAHRETLSRPVAVLNRNAVRWTDDRAAVSFMTVTDPALLRWSAAVSSLADGRVSAALTRNLHDAAAFFEALGAAGLAYVVDPASPYQSLSRDGAALDHIRYPLETLDQRGGDCDDLSVLYCTLLESVGVPAAFIAVPGHILSAFDLGISAEEAAGIYGEEGGFIFRGGRTWVPVETTLVGGSFSAALQAGSRTWTAAEAAGAATFFSVREAWEQFPPPEFPSVGAAVLPARDGLTARYGEAVAQFRTAAMEKREKALLDEAARSPSAAAENRLGVLYAQFGLLDKAQERFSRALAGGEYLPALINTAGVLSLTGNHGQARTVLDRARELSPEDPRVLLGLAFSYRRSGEHASAAAAYEAASRIAPALAARYPLEASAPSAVAGRAAGRAVSGRASRGGEDGGYIGDEWAE